jgi:glycosyltransferase involved in cell wall biosynthesis
MSKISIVLTSFNHEKYIEEAIDSVLNQTFTDFELIILDDGSSDNSWALITQYSDSRIKAFHSEVNRGSIEGVNRAIFEVAVGEYIAIHHSDDVWELDKLEKQVAYLEAHSEIGAVFTWVHAIDEHGDESTEEWFDQGNKTRWEWLNQLFNEQNHLSHPSVLIRKQCYHDVGAYRYGLAQTADAEMWSRVLIKYPIHIIQEKLTRHRLFSDKSNASGHKIEVAVRTCNEWNVLRENYLLILNDEDIIATFPSLKCYRTPKGFDRQFLLAMACLYECKQRSAWQLGLKWLFDLLNDKARYPIIRELYSFSDLDFIRMTAEFDVHFLEGDRQIASLNQAVAKRDASLNQIYTSRSWRLTRPLRFSARLMRAPMYGIAKLPQLLPTLPGTPYKVEALGLGVNHKILLVTHQFSRTGAPYAVLYLARALFSIYGVRPAVICPQDGPIREEFERELFPTIVDPLLFSYSAYSSEACEFVEKFERVIVTSLASFSFIRYFRGIGKRLTWWIHETDIGFTAVANMGADLPLLFAACESLWLGSPLCFPLARQYASQKKLHLLLYGCVDTVVPHRPHKSGKIVFTIVGSVEQRKGQDVFLDAIERLPEELRCHAIFRIIGSPLPHASDSAIFYKKICVRAALIPEVECIESMPIDKLQEFYSETDVLVSASRDDPMPIALTQGLMFSKVCVCSSAIGHAQLLKNKKDGLIFASESAEELSGKMSWLLRNPAELVALGAAGRALYEKHFLMSSFADNVGKLMQDGR